MKRAGIAILLALLMPGCSMFFPSHPGLWIYGSVVKVDGESGVAGATVSVFSTNVRTGPNGCLKIHPADALPFKFTVNSAGYKPAVSIPPRGFFQVFVALAKEESNSSSSVEWKEVSEQAFAASPNCN